MPIHIPEELQFVQVPSFVKPPSQTGENFMERPYYKNLNRENVAVRQNRAYIPETRFETVAKPREKAQEQARVENVRHTPPPAPGVHKTAQQRNNHEKPNSGQGSFFSLFGENSGSSLDKDTLLLIALIVLLSKEKADIKLIMALVSILF
jgi:hypothetical protein